MNGPDALEELHASEWLRHDVGDHAGCGNPLKHDVVPIDAVKDVEVPNTDMLAATRRDRELTAEAVQEHEACLVLESKCVWL